VILEIVRCCASGAKGNGALLVFQLCTLLFILEPNTKIRVNLGGCKAESKAFWEKVGFSADGEADVAEFARASNASTSALLTDVSAETSPKRARKESFVDVLTMSVKDRKTWEAYLTTEHVERKAIDSEIAAVTEINEHLLASQWSKEAVRAWEVKELERYYSHDGAQKSKEDIASDIKATRTRLEKLPKDLIGTRVTVKGNGSCWLYAVMAGYGGTLDHANPVRGLQKAQPEKTPTARDYRMSSILMRAMQTHVLGRNKVFMKDAQEQERNVKLILGLKCASDTQNGTWGGTVDTFGVLANLLHVPIIVLDVTSPKHFVVYKGDEECSEVFHPWDTLETVLKSFWQPNPLYIVVEYNGSGHFAGYLPSHLMHFTVPVWWKAFFQGFTTISHIGER
jgi:hypothetical protein